MIQRQIDLKTAVYNIMVGMERKKSNVFMFENYFDKKIKYGVFRISRSYSFIASGVDLFTFIGAILSLNISR